jgi:hypothetical protein
MTDSQNVPIPLPAPTPDARVAGPVGVESAIRSVNRGGFRSLDSLTIALRVLFIVDAALFVTLAWLFLQQRSYLYDIFDGTRPMVADPGQLNGLVGNFSAFSFMVAMAIAVVFIIWFHGARGNADFLGDQVPLSPGWAIGAWFIPLGGQVIPAMIAVGMWKVGPDRSKRSAVLVITWWVVSLVGLVLLGVGTNNDPADYDYSNSKVSIDTLINDKFWAAGGALTLAAGAILAIFVVNGISKSQTQRSAGGS